MPGNSPIRYANYTRQSKLGLAELYYAICFPASDPTDWS
jgi:hypothetical protein